MNTHFIYIKPHLTRTTDDAYGNAIYMDNLTYTYDGISNKLLNVSDVVSNQNTGSFFDGDTNPSLNDYEYDANGNMVKDRNKGITEIHYNHLHLPTEIQWSGNEKSPTFTMQQDKI